MKKENVDYRVEVLVAEAAPQGDEPDADAVDRIDEAAVEWRRGFVPEARHGARLDHVLVDLAPEFSRSHLQQLLADGHVRLDGAPADTASRRVRAGQAVEVELVPTAQSRAFRAEAMALAIVHEDAHLLVVDKPAGRVVHPAAGNWSGTLLNGLLAHHAGAGLLPRAGIVHRLDKDTSGLMVVGKTLEAVTALVRAIAAREVHREYLAIAHGEPVRDRFTVAEPVGRDARNRIRMAVVASGKPARTDVDVLWRGGGFSGLRCTLHTGRTHQIRVHLAAQGHPLVADAVYGGSPALGLRRQALHAHRLAFAHPVGGAALSFESPLPADLAAAWASREVRGSVA